MIDRLLMTAGVAVLLAVGPASAQDAAPPGEAAKATGEATSEATIPMESPQHLRAGNVIGATVVGAGGEDVGRVSDLLLDEDGQLVAIVFTSGGVLGIGGKKIAVAKEHAEITRDRERDRMVVRVALSQERIEETTEFSSLDDQRRAAERGAREQAPAGGPSPP